MIRLPRKVIAATLLVAVAPVAAVWALRAAGALDSFLACSALGAALSLGSCQLAARIWERRTGTGDVLFGDLMVWGWARRCLQQRRLDDAVATLGLHRTEGGSDPVTLSVERRAAMLERLAGDLEGRDPYTHGHSRRVARYSAMIARRMGATGAELARIRTAAAVHDIGKLETPIEILHKPGKLTDSEFEIVRRHPAAGARMVEILEDDRLAAIVRHHHERLDGSGYPDRLAGGQIPLGARIIAVADTFDAITSARPYRAAKPHRAALAILRAEAGSQLDRDAVGAFCSVYRGRRTLGAWIALTDLAERLLAWLAPDAIGATARTVAIAATAAAVGGGAAAIPAGAVGARGREAPRTAVAAGPQSPAGAAVGSSGSSRSSSTVAGGRRTGARLRRGGGLGAATRIPHPGGRRSTNAPPSGGAFGAGRGAGGGTAGTPAGTVTDTSGSSPATTVAASAAGAGASAAVTPSGVQLHLGVGPASASGPSSGVAIGSGSQGASVGVQVGGGSGASVSTGVTVAGGAGGAGSDAGGGTGSDGSAGATAPGAGASVGSTSSGTPAVAAQVNLPGVASVNVRVG